MYFQADKQPIYIFRHPFRFVKPYNHTFQTHAKKRWLGKPLLQTVAKQFQAYSQQYFIQAIKLGRITINNKIVSADYVIKNSDLLKHETIREQPPILDLPIQIIYQDQQFLVVNKPPSMVVHTGGGYHYNTLMAILHYEMGYKNLYILHRIDRLTSGIVIISKIREKTTKFHEQSMQQVMKKCYYARVSGDVQFQNKTVNASLICLSHRQGIWGVYDQQKMKQMQNLQKPKQSCTKFTKLWYDQKTNSTLLQCYPITGRTHQIRVHLQHIGHSILNDTGYGGRFVGNCIVDMIDKIKNEVENNKQVKDKVEKMIPRTKGQIIQKNENQEQKKQQKLQQQWFKKWDYKNRPLQIFLHSYKYTFEGKQYINRKPYWADPHIQLQKQQQQNINGHHHSQKLRSSYQQKFLKQKKQQKQKLKQSYKKQEQNEQKPVQKQKIQQRNQIKQDQKKT